MKSSVGGAACQSESCCHYLGRGDGLTPTPGQAFRMQFYNSLPPQHRLSLSDEPGSSSGEQEMSSNDRARHRASVGLWLKSAKSAPDPYLNRLILSLFLMH